jgi:hypothetical protein
MPAMQILVTPNFRTGGVACTGRRVGVLCGVVGVRRCAVRGARWRERARCAVRGARWRERAAVSYSSSQLRVPGSIFGGFGASGANNGRRGGGGGSGGGAGGATSGGS